MAAMKSFLLVALGLTSSVTAHGILTQVSANGKKYDCYNPWATKQATADTIGYRIPAYPKNPYVSPPQFGSPDIICHNGATPGNLWVDVVAGSEIVLQWTPYPVSHKGCLATYLANCGNGRFEDVKKESLKFVKLMEDGLHTNSTNVTKAGEWASDTFINNGSKVSVQIPSYVAPGNYVLRNENLALHGANPGSSGAQLYPQCINIKVTGSGTDDLTSGGTLGEELYKSTDPGFNVNLYLPVNYIIPGPPLYKSGGKVNSVVPAAMQSSASAAVTYHVTAPTGTVSPVFNPPITSSNATVLVPAPTATDSSGTKVASKPGTPGLHLARSNSPDENGVEKDGSKQSSPRSETSNEYPAASDGNKLKIPNDATVDELMNSLDKIDSLLKRKLVGKHRRRARDMRTHH